MKNTAIILASGKGLRLGTDIPKQFCIIKGKPVLEYSIEAFENHKKIDSIVVVGNPDFMDSIKKISSKYKKVSFIVSGGETRQISSYKGVMSIKDKGVDNVLIHDGARPFVNADIIDRCIDALKQYSAVNTAVPCSDTIIQVDKNKNIKAVVDRNLYYRCQTPQCFRYSLIKKAHELAHKEECFNMTDDCSLILKYNLASIHTINGNENNIKITYPKDIKLAEILLECSKSQNILTN